MKQRLSIFRFALFAFALSMFAGLAHADGTGARALTPALHEPAAQTQAPCPATASRAIGLAQAQTKCCEGHMGVCGCRAGKIVCCDGTVSADPKCTCHSDFDSGIVN